MQFLEKSKEFDKNSLRKNPLLKKLILFLVFTLILFLGLDVLVHHHQIGLTLTTATDTILGNEEEFLDPILFDTILERVHGDILSAMITLMLLSTILIRLSPKSKQRLVHFSFITAILTPIALLIAPSTTLFILLWIVLFLLWHILAFVMGLSILWKLLK